MRLIRGGLFFALIFSMFLPVLKAEEDLPNAASKEEQFKALEQDVYKAFKDKNYEDAAAKCKAQLELFPKQPGPYYNLACAQARLDKKEDALTSLEKSVELGYNDPGHMKEDEDLAILREEKKFGDLATKAAENEKKNGRGYEPGAEIKGVKSVEDFPEGGLRYRLRLGEEATEEKPHKLVIWLHPSGGSMNNIVEKQLSADLAKHGYALLVFTQKQWQGWSGDEAEKLLKKTLPAVMKVKGVAQEKPILLGFSAGGQLALQLWEQNPTGFAGLILDAAYPIDVQLYMQQKFGLMKLPKDEGIKKMPFLVFVGSADPSKIAWEKAEPVWHEAGVPLTVHYVPNGKHQWLVGPAQKKELLAWLDEVNAGKLPGVATAKTKDGAGGKEEKDPMDALMEKAQEGKKAQNPESKVAPKSTDDGLGGDREY